ncbi:hypothetical protein EDC01DRAFT_647516 [Geopyxis carbonaria]|nr:hypothetical protein EDC01DRAFT_647516 [Geopyxis carbonaria]
MDRLAPLREHLYHNPHPPSFPQVALLPPLFLRAAAYTITTIAILFDSFNFGTSIFIFLTALVYWDCYRFQSGAIGSGWLLFTALPSVVLMGTVVVGLAFEIMFGGSVWMLLAFPGAVGSAVANAWIVIQAVRQFRMNEVSGIRLGEEGSRAREWETVEPGQ